MLRLRQILRQLREGALKSSIWDRAKKYFGQTTNYLEAGYLLPDGTLLDLSGKSRGGPGNERVEDHREINHVLTPDEHQQIAKVHGPHTINSGAMIEFVNMGAIRMHAWRKDLSLNFGPPKPTEQQWLALEEMLRWFSEGSVYVDISNRRGDALNTKEWDAQKQGRPLNARAIIKALKDCWS